MPSAPRNSLVNRILRRVRARGRGAVVMPSDFADIGSRGAVSVALVRLTKDGSLRRIGCGLYDLPRLHPVLGDLGPSVDGVVSALQRKDRCTFIPGGGAAANMLGLSEQVPMKLLYYTRGRSRTVKAGRMPIRLVHRNARMMAAAGRTAGMLISALAYLGREHVDDRTIAKLRSRLPAEERRTLAADAKHAPAWIADIMRRLAADAEAVARG